MGTILLSSGLTYSHQNIGSGGNKYELLWLGKSSG